MMITAQNSNRPFRPAKGVRPEPAGAEPPSVQDDGFSRQEREELDYWQGRLKSQMGVVTTPPAGAVAKEMEIAHDYIVDVLDRVAGKEITESNMELRVELFSGDVAQAGLDDSMSREQSWERRHGEDTWPIRDWMEVPDAHQEKPIYRLAVNLGMLNSLNSEDELAFVLAHQAERILDHIKQDPDNEEVERPRQSFLDSRDMQAAADKAAIARIAKAGYNPRAALKALNTLYTLNPIEYPQEDLNRALTAAAHGHEAEGMRVSAVQAEVEDFVRRGDPTASQEMKPLPDSVKVQARPNYDKPVDDIEEFKANYQSLAEELATDDSPGWMFRQGVPPREHLLIQKAEGDRIDKEVALLAAANHLNGLETKTPQQKVDGMLRLMLSLRYSALPEDSFSRDGKQTLHNFMAENGKDWNPQTFFETLNHGQRNLSFSFVHYLVYNRNFQDMVGGQALPGLAEGATKSWLTRTYDEPQPEFLPSLIKKNHDDDHETWPLAKEMDAAVLKYVPTIDPTEMLSKTGRSGLSEATEFANNLFGLKEPNSDFMSELRAAGSNLAERAGESRENKARLRLRLPLQDPKGLDRFMEEFGESESWKEFSPQFEADLKVLLKDLSTVSVTQEGLHTSKSDESQYAHGLERRFAEQVKVSQDPKEQRIALDHLTRHLYPSRRVRAHTPRRAWLGEAARVLAADGVAGVLQQLEGPDRSQYAKGMFDSLVSTYRLQPEDLPDTSTKSLQALAERVQNDEFKPKREDYQSDYAHRTAVREYNQRRSDLREVLQPVAPIEARGVLSKMALVGHDQELSKELTKDLQLPDFVRLMDSALDAQNRFKATTSLYRSEDEIDTGADAGGFLVDGLVAVQGQVKTLDQWYDLAEKTVDFSNGGLEARLGAKKALGKNLFERLQGLESKAIRKWLNKEKTFELLSPEQSSDLLVQCLGEECKPGVDAKYLATKVEELDKAYILVDEHPIDYLEFRDKVAEKAQLQPSTVDTVFPEVVRGVTDTNEVYRENARSLSGLIALARERSPQEQLNTIEYLMGRQDVMPAYLEETAEDQAFAPLRESLETTREDLLTADSHTRVMIANSFLAGPSGVLRTDEGKEAVIDHFLVNLKDENRDLGEKIARGVLYSHGDADTLAVAFILGQLPEEPKEGQDPGKSGKLDEATILNRLFDAYGVPGIKMKQYLAFTSEFKDFKDAFEDAQDSAMPLNYYQTLKLVQNRFGDEWPKDMKIDRVLGSGSVNVAVRYRNEKTGKREVVSLGRQDIEESTQYDFDRFNKLIGYMTQTPEDKEKYGYILGLLSLINDSVALEFKKEQAMGVQQTAYRTYNHDNNGWQVKSIDAYSVKNLGLFMQEAKGKTARKIYNKDQAVYKEAMEAMSEAEFGVLRGQDSSNNWRPKPMFANPDFHDGQVMIDEESKTVTILDFGQAVPISNDDRVGGLDLLTIIGKADSAKNAAKRINRRYFPDAEEPVITKEILEPILEREDRMDCFIHLLSTLSRNGAEVPLSSVHWVLGLNRQMALREKIGDPIDSDVRNMVINHKAGLPLATYNATRGSGSKLAEIGKSALNTAVNVTRSLTNSVAGVFGLTLFSEPSTFAAPQEPKEAKEAKYRAWRPDFR